MSSSRVVARSRKDAPEHQGLAASPLPTSHFRGLMVWYSSRYDCVGGKRGVRWACDARKEQAGRAALHPDNYFARATVAAYPTPRRTASQGPRRAAALCDQVPSPADGTLRPLPRHASPHAAPVSKTSVAGIG